MIKLFILLKKISMKIIKLTYKSYKHIILCNKLYDKIGKIMVESMAKFFRDMVEAREKLVEKLDEIEHNKTK